MLSMMGNPSATSPVMPHCLDPKREYRGRWFLHLREASDGGPSGHWPHRGPCGTNSKSGRPAGRPRVPAKPLCHHVHWEPNMCPRCNKRVYFAEKVTSLGKDWHRPCPRCERCSKTLTPGGHAEHDGQPYCHKPCYGILFGPKGVNTGAVGSYIYDKDPEGTVQP
nr:estradiol-stimulated protein ESP1 - rat [Rattus norvegicus]